jgi:hypothetical protein
VELASTFELEECLVGKLRAGAKWLIPVAVVALALAGFVLALAATGSPKKHSDDAVATISQPPIDGIPQGSITISRQRPNLGPGAATYSTTFARKK